MISLKVVIFVLVFSVALAQKLSVSGKQITYNGRSVFLNGINQAWVNYGMDFGNDNSAKVWGEQMKTLDQLKAAGGNSIRYWLLVEGKNIPQFSGNGYVLSTDAGGNLIRDTRNYVREAAKRGIAVIFCLWNAAVMSNQQEKDLFWDDGKLQSFIDKALVPLVQALKNEPGLGAWEILNEPEAAISIAGDSNPCFDSSKLGSAGAGWARVNIPMKNILKFINWQADAIKNADPTALVTVGSWSERANTDNYGYTNYYKDSCLRAAGGRQRGILDFYQIHSYSYHGNFGPNAPFKVSASNYNLEKPVVLGEFAEDLGDGHGGGGMNVVTLARYIADHGYQGAWGWADQGSQKDLFFRRMFDGVSATRDRTTPLFGVNNGGGSGTPPSGGGSSGACDDVPPSNDYTCQQQKGFGQCNQPWMNGFCKSSCGKCVNTCDDVPPSNDYTCQQQKGFGQCNQPWMNGFCKRSCGKCSGGCNDIAPSSDYTCQQQKNFGKCNQPWMNGFCKVTCGTCGSQAVDDTDPFSPNNYVSQDNSLSSVAIGIIVAGVVLGVLMMAMNILFIFGPKPVEKP